LTGRNKPCKQNVEASGSILFTAFALAREKRRQAAAVQTGGLFRGFVCVFPNYRFSTPPFSASELPILDALAKDSEFRIHNSA
jgi:hypothetical protein